MNKKQVMEIMNYLSNIYKDFNITDEMVTYWYNDLQLYDYEDVNARLKDLLGQERYSYQSPTLEAIVRGLTKVKEKTSLEDFKFYCQFCQRMFDKYEDMVEHEDRCRSIRYIQRQYEKYNWGEINKKELYNMGEEEFDSKYKQLLKKVQEVTKDENEKKRIKLIFNPPMRGTAKVIIGGSNEK